jgi:L-lactate dehydrogenase (cytochrome)
MKAACVKDYQLIAKKKLPKFLFEYLDGGSYSEVTKNQNLKDLEALSLRQRVLRGSSNIDTKINLFGSTYNLPVALGPVGLAGMYARRGECQALRAAEKSGVPFSLSTVGVCSLNEVAKASNKPFWFQLYMIKDRSFMVDLLTQAREAKCSALIFTVDMPVPGSRYRDYHSGLAGESWLSGNIKRFSQAMMKPSWALDVGLLGMPHKLGNVTPLLKKNSGLEDFMAWMGNNFDPTVTWKDIEFVRDNWDGPIILKGILDPEDARQAATMQVDGLIVSNHGGRQLDGVLSSVKCLPRIADVVGDQLDIMVDGGITSGLDVVRMLALGAKSVLLGRAWVYALAAKGQIGVEHVIDLIHKEMIVAMTLTGCHTLSDINEGVIDNLSNNP